MSVICYLTDRSWPGVIYLVYSIHRPQDFVFQDELDHRQRRHSNLHFAVAVSHPEGTDWQGHKGRISKDFITQSKPDVASRYVHICEPVSMMEAVKKIRIEF